MEEQAPHIAALFRPGAKGEPMQRLDAVEVVADFGFRDDRKARSGSKRQVLLLDEETIREFGFQPGDLDENITTCGFAVSELRRGQQVRIGDVLLEVTIERPTCHKLDELQEGLGEAMRNRRGMMTVALHGGEIHVGDAISVGDPPVTAHEDSTIARVSSIR